MPPRLTPWMRRCERGYKSLDRVVGIFARALIRFGLATFALYLIIIVWDLACLVFGHPEKMGLLWLW